MADCLDEAAGRLLVRIRDAKNIVEDRIARTVGSTA